MPDLEQQIAQWREEVRQEFPHRPEIIDELEDHLRENVRILIEQGTSPAEAVAQAARRIGSPQSLSIQFKHLKTHATIMQTVRIGHAVRVAATLAFACLLIPMLLSLGLTLFDLYRAATSSAAAPSLATASNRFLSTLPGCLILTLLISLGWPWRSAPVVKSPGGWPNKILCLGLSFWVGFMVLRLGVIGLGLIQKGIGPWSRQADPAFFGSLMMSFIGSYVIWLLWPWRAARPVSEGAPPA